MTDTPCATFPHCGSVKTRWSSPIGSDPPPLSKIALLKIITVVES